MHSNLSIKSADVFQWSTALAKPSKGVDGDADFWKLYYQFLLTEEILQSTAIKRSHTGKGKVLDIERSQTI